MDNIYMVKPSRYKWYENRYSTSMWRSVTFGFIGGVCSFDPTITWDTTRILCLYEEGVCHISHRI